MTRRIVLLIPLLAAAVFGGCKEKTKYGGLFTQKFDPDMTGRWTSAMKMDNGGGNATISFTMTQRDIHLRGVYEQAHASGADCFGEEGDVTGVTTGGTITFTMKPRDAGCEGQIEASGQPAAGGYSVSFSGTGCDGAPVRGQGELSRS